MAKSYYSMVLNHSCTAVWSVIRQFDHYAWAGVESETMIEEGKRGDQISAVRRVTLGQKIIRQVLLAHSDLDHSYTYAFLNPVPFPVRDYTATIRITPVVDTNGAFVEWWATFDCAADERERWVNHFENEGFARWLGALRQFMSSYRPPQHRA